MMRTTLLAGLVAAALAVAPAASAKPGKRSFERTYPHASALCAKNANGRTPKRLAASVKEVAGACATLKTSFVNAQNAYTTTVAPLEQQARDTVAAARANCRGAADRPACRTARHDARVKLRGLRRSVTMARWTYHDSVDGARQAFWGTIRSLRGGSSITPDAKVGPSPTTTLPNV
jgi:hypothetical protein